MSFLTIATEYLSSKPSGRCDCW